MMRAKTSRRGRARASSASSIASISGPVTISVASIPACGGDRARGRGIVAGDHHDANAGRTALVHRLRNAGAQRIGEPDQTQKREGKAARRRGGRKVGREGRARDASTRMPSRGHFVDESPQRSRSGAASAHSSAIASGAPFAAAKRAGSPVAPELVTASSSGRTPISRSSVSPRCGSSSAPRVFSRSA